MDDLEQRRGEDKACDMVKGESENVNNTVHLMPAVQALCRINCIGHAAIDA